MIDEIRLFKNEDYNDDQGVAFIISNHLIALFKEVDALGLNIHERDLFYVIESEARRCHLDRVIFNKGVRDD